MKRNRKNGGSGVVDWIKQKAHILDKDTIIRKIKKYNQIIKDNQKSSISFIQDEKTKKARELIAINTQKLEDIKENKNYNEAITEMKQTEAREAEEKEIMRQSIIEKNNDDSKAEELRCNLILSDINDINTYNQKMKEARDSKNVRDIECLDKRYTHQYINQKKNS